MSSLYETDFYSWAKEQAAGLRLLADRRPNTLPELDWQQLAQEVEGLGRSLERELYSRLTVLLLHLLKWHFQPSFQSKSWELTITNQRRELARLVAKNPGLKSKVAEEYKDAYAPARLQAASETGLALQSLPEVCPFSQAQALDENFWPDEEHR